MSIIQELRQSITDAQKKIKQIQEACSHPELTLKIEHSSSTGNYDPTCDGYWTTYTCGLCEKRWTTEQK